MTPKEKAEELVHKYRMLLMNEDTDCGEEILVSRLSKQCALIAVDEIGTLKADSFDKLPNPHHYFSRDYWREVKQEIEKL